MVDDTPVSFCPQCGNRVGPNDVFCSGCGNTVRPQAPPMAPVYTPPMPVKRKPNIVAPIVLIIVLAIVVILLMSNIPQELLEEGGTGFTDITDDSYSAGAGTYSYSWKYDGDTYTLKFNMSNAKYLEYLNNPTTRHMTSMTDYNRGLNFITANDSLIQSIKASLVQMRNSASLDQEGTASMVLSFVQQAIPYKFDNVTHTVEDYWNFPIETLHDGYGDCEDKSFLYTSLMVAMGYSTSLLIFEDHVAVGLSCTGVYGSYYTVGGLKYYYCETTNPGWEIGEIPDGYSESHVVVV